MANANFRDKTKYILNCFAFESTVSALNRKEFLLMAESVVRGLHGLMQVPIELDAGHRMQIERAW